MQPLLLASQSISGTRFLLAGVAIFLVASLFLRLARPRNTYPGGSHVVIRLVRWPAVVLALVGLALILLGHR